MRIHLGSFRGKKFLHDEERDPRPEEMFCHEINMQVSWEKLAKLVHLGFVWNGHQMRKKNGVFGARVLRESICGKIEM